MLFNTCITKTTSAIVYRRTLLTMLLLSVPSFAQQTVDSYQFGRLQGIAVKGAIELDHFLAVCSNNRSNSYLKLTNTALEAVGINQPASVVLKGMAQASGVLVDRMKQSFTDEMDRNIRNLGGCKSNQLMSKIEEAKGHHVKHIDDLMYVADLRKKNPNRAIFR